MAEVLFRAARPRLADAHLLDREDGAQLFLVDGSRLFDIDSDIAEAVREAFADPTGGSLRALMTEYGLEGRGAISAEPPRRFAVRALSLAIAQKCNLGCTYCYAQGGEFGQPAKSMTEETARAAVDLLLEETKPGERANLAFLGGEPLVAREALRRTTVYAAERAAGRGVRLTFSITTNGTLLRADDAAFFEEHGFAVTLSLDGIGTAHDRLRPFKTGASSYDRIVERAKPLLETQRRMQVSARVTVTPANLALRETLDAFVALGFHSVGFSPMLSAPSERHEMEARDLALMLAEMVSCADAFEEHLRAGRRYPFANLLNALREIHKGTHRPYPCGAGAGYLGVSADGDLAACHRFVGDEAGAMGDLVRGVDRERQSAWLAGRHVDRQQPCSGCWARYLCGGGCHHETLSRGRPACDFIRGWLHHSIKVYGRLSRDRLLDRVL
ncbi:MAG TPA: radical SAM protein [Allosphingosinicella sp.]